uniref:Bm13022 n=1 Tax=Brugia malayi TaxID=6279 RepID=A0A1I9G8M6_BRUMA|nr:Bm13022 [Brugia malayi]
MLESTRLTTFVLRAYQLVIRFASKPDLIVDRTDCYGLRLSPRSFRTSKALYRMHF